MAPVNPSNNRPVFIIGCPRSGTTLLRLMLDSHPNISCGPETSFLIDMKPIVVHHWPHIKLYGFSKEYWHQKIAEFFSSFQIEYAQKRGKKRWAEKTPHYTPHLKFILDLFPDSQLVHIIRDGRDVVASHRNRYGYVQALKSIIRWREYVTIGHKFGQRASKGQYFELRYEDLVNNTEATLRNLLGFLNEPWDESVLKYMDASHDIQPRYFEFTKNRREDIEGDEMIYNSRIGSWQRELDPFLEFSFNIWAGRLARELGYL
ncbi:MAG TPA: sulfotransferase [Desulfobacteraceae bacterium]|nr:sulfotransferase [Desulfobacteraceae bacterium]HPJ66399.1 sulfotransferase [Desulfobacteraceae bacterium]HPQ27321.1 sulfotransferase [Desulfobacteraceae bacterium]